MYIVLLVTTREKETVADTIDVGSTIKCLFERFLELVFNSIFVGICLTINL